MERYVPEKENEEEKLKRRRKNRRFNTVLYIVAALLIVFGVIIILRDQTDLFNHNTAAIPDATRPPENTAGATADPTADVWISPGPVVTEIASDAPLPSESADPEPTQTPAPTEPSTDPSQPVSVYFEEHGISVKVVPVGVNDRGEMATVPKHDVAGWYMYGAAPNEPGNCIIAGHNRYSGQKGLFSILHKGLKVGDHVWVTLENGDIVFYKVVSITNYKYDAVPPEVMAQSEETKLTLITCLGDFDYILQMSKTRVVAVCEPIN